MKKTIVLGASTIILVIVGFLLFSFFIGKDYDVSIKRSDNTKMRVFTDVAKYEPKDYSKTYKTVSFISNTKYKSKLAESPLYVKQINDNMHLLYQEGYYYVASSEMEGEDEVITLAELSAWIHLERRYDYVFPFIYDNSVGMRFSEEERDTDEFILIRWADTIDMHSFDDVVAFYAKTDADKYVIDSVNRIIYFKLHKPGFDDAGEWTDFRGKITFTEEGMEISFPASVRNEVLSIK